jgi:regulator of sigma E protease
MDLFVTIITFFIMLIVLVVAHEFGHFMTAKSRGVQVLEFGIGFPPRIWGIRRGETLYSINALPLGGFVKLAGEEDPKVPRSLASKGYGTRILVLSAGSLMNILLPVILFTIAFMIPHNTYVSPSVIESVSVNSPAALAGVQPGDILLEINGIKINNPTDVQRYIQLGLGKQVSIKLQHPDSSIHTVSVEPRWKPPQGQGATGIKLFQWPLPPKTLKESKPIWEAVPSGLNECGQTLVLFKNEIVRWIIGAASPQVTGPVGMAEMTGEVVKEGISPLVQFAAFISINLGIVNILPLPALDGGRIAFVLLEMLRRGRRVSAKTEGIIHSIGFILLIGLILLVTFGDISNIIKTGSALP